MKVNIVFGEEINFQATRMRWKSWGPKPIRWSQKIRKMEID